MRARIAAVVGLGVLIVGIVIAQFQGQPPSPEGRPQSSPSDTGSLGLSGWVALLEEYEHPVEVLAEAPSQAGLDSGSTVVLLDPGAILAEDVDALVEHVEEGGRLIFGGRADERALIELLGGTGSIGSDGLDVAAPLVSAPEVAGVGTVEPGGAASFSDTGAALPLIGEGELTLAASSALGDGRALVLADSGSFRNDRLASADNAALALAIVGPPGQPVQFVDRVRAVPGEGLAALPVDWLWAGLGLLLAGLLLIASRARRLGPPAGDPGAQAPPRTRYIDAISGILARAKDPSSAAAPLRRALRGAIVRRTALPADPEAAELRAAAARLDLDPVATEAMVAPVTDERGLIALAAALAKLNGPQTTERSR